MKFLRNFLSAILVVTSLGFLGVGSTTLTGCSAYEAIAKKFHLPVPQTTAQKIYLGRVGVAQGFLTTRVSVEAGVLKSKSIAEEALKTGDATSNSLDMVEAALNTESSVVETLTGINVSEIINKALVGVLGYIESNQMTQQASATVQNAIDEGRDLTELEVQEGRDFVVAQRAKLVAAIAEM